MPDYTIKSGDTLSGITAKYGVTVDSIMQANPGITDKNSINAGSTIKLPDSPKNEKMGGECDAGKCGNLFSLRAPDETVADISIIPNVNGKAVPKLEGNKPFKFENTLQDSNKGPFELKFNNNKIEVTKDMGEIPELSPKKPEDVRSLTMQWEQCRVPEAQTSPIYPYILSQANNAKINGKSVLFESWEKNLLAQAKTSASGAEYVDVQVIEVSPVLPAGDYDLDNLDDAAHVSKALEKPMVGSLTGLAASIALLVNSAEKRMFWKQMLHTTKITVKRAGGHTYVYFRGGKSFQSMIKGTAKSLEKAKNAFVNMGSAYKVGGLKASKIAMIEQYVAPSAKSVGKGSIIGLLIVVGVESFSYFSKPEAERHLSDYLVGLGTSVTKFAIAAVAGVLAGAIAIGVFSAPVVVIVAAGVLVSFFVGVWLDSKDKEIGVTESLKKTARNSSVEEQLENRLPPIKPAWQR